MNSTIRRAIVIACLLAAAMVSLPGRGAAQDNPPPQPIELPCATHVSAQVLGKTPVNDGEDTLMLVRVIFAPGGSISEHTHPGTMVITVESGSFGFTLVSEGEMTLNRAATADAEASTEPMLHGEEVVINPGDWTVETGMIHTARNLSDEPTTVLLSAMIEAEQPLTICVDDSSTPVAVQH
jgi:quercetin dioxygenase-like cupin family protein